MPYHAWRCAHHDMELAIDSRLPAVDASAISRCAPGPVQHAHTERLGRVLTPPYALKTSVMSTGRHRAYRMPRPFPLGRVGLKTFLAAAGISKNTFFLKYRHDPYWIAVFDIEEDRDHRLHFPDDAGEKLRVTRGTRKHFNHGRRPKRLCPACGTEAHPRHAICAQCEHPLHAPRDDKPAEAYSTAVRNGARREGLRRAKEQAPAVAVHNSNRR